MRRAISLLHDAWILSQPLLLLGASHCGTPLIGCALPGCILHRNKAQKF
jgi:hypothetical protein